MLGSEGLDLCGFGAKQVVNPKLLQVSLKPQAYTREKCAYWGHIKDADKLQHQIVLMMLKASDYHADQWFETSRFEWQTFLKYWPSGTIRVCGNNSLCSFSFCIQVLICCCLQCLLVACHEVFVSRNFNLAWATGTAKSYSTKTNQYTSMTWSVFEQFYCNNIKCSKDLLRFCFIQVT